MDSDEMLPKWHGLNPLLQSASKDCACFTSHYNISAVLYHAWGSRKLLIFLDRPRIVEFESLI